MIPDSLKKEISLKDLRLPRLGGPSLKKPSFRGPNFRLTKNQSFRLAEHSENDIVGIELEAGSVAATQVHVNGHAQVTAAAVQPLPPGAFEDGEVRDPEAVSAALRELFEANKFSRRVRLGIANQRVVVRTLRLPAIENPDELDSAVRFAAQEEIPMPIEQAVLDHRVVGGVAAAGDGPPQIDVIVVAARREMISASLRPLRDADLEPVGVDLSAFGMIRALGEAAPAYSEDAGADEPAAQRAVLYCNVGDVTNLAVAKGRSCLFTRVSPTGLEEIVSGLVSDIGLLPEHARQWVEYVGLEAPTDQIGGDPELVSRVRGILERGADALIGELRLSLDFYGGQEGAVAVEQVVLCGPGTAIPGLTERMGAGLGLPVTVGRPTALAGYEPALASRLTLPFGIALED
jgi:type IV pilus assembly protein PilM